MNIWIGCQTLKKYLADAPAGYLWTDMHLSGTIDEPRQDLSQRIIELFKESPGAYLGLMFRQFGDWLKKTFGD